MKRTLYPLAALLFCALPFGCSSELQDGTETARPATDAKSIESTSAGSGGTITMPAAHLQRTKTDAEQGTKQAEVSKGIARAGQELRVVGEFNADLPAGSGPGPLTVKILARDAKGGALIMNETTAESKPLQGATHWYEGKLLAPKQAGTYAVETYYEGRSISRAPLEVK